jgi:hypothetical protein
VTGGESSGEKRRPPFSGVLHLAARYCGAMTDEEMIAVLRRLHDAFNRGDFEAALKLAHPRRAARMAGAGRLRGTTR